jgi:hypothetical protein
MSEKTETESNAHQKEITGSGRLHKIVKPRVLHLTLYLEWFEQIAKGIKKFEYRDRTPYWAKRIENRVYDEIRFVNGYGAHRPFMRVQYLGWEIDGLKAPDIYAIELGDILEIGNYQGV